ncbi:MAG TPA: VacJ family lipoprotein [Gammaproteobacteria bacterium]|jgi:phospholipid-binding lipoprotein MlaA|nr:VacJ family lipoprotein [Gammaproteobacteria bacterium]
MREKNQKIPPCLNLARIFCLIVTLLLYQNQIGYAQTTNSTAASTVQAASNPPNNLQADTTLADDAYGSDISDSTPAVSPKDPYEKFNRVMFVINDKIDAYILKPLAIVYNTVLPRPVNTGIHNFFLNLGTLPTIANDLLQFNFYQAANDMWRFSINTTIGVVGIFDVAEHIGLAPYTNDFGMTLANWGFVTSNYFVLPFFGPTSVRDGVGLFVDYFAFTVYPHIHPKWKRYAIYGLGVVDQRAQVLRFESVMEEAAIDKYVFLRSAYVQHRNYQMKRNQELSAKDQLAKKELPSQKASVPETAPESVID